MASGKMVRGLTEGDHAAEAANVGVELLDALDQLVAGINVHPRILVRQSIGGGSSGTDRFRLPAAAARLRPLAAGCRRCCCRWAAGASAAAAGDGARAPPCDSKLAAHRRRKHACLFSAALHPALKRYRYLQGGFRGPVQALQTANTCETW